MKRSYKCINSSSSVVAYNSSNNILDLPDEILLLIVSKLNTMDRLPLGVTCRTLRQIDLILGKQHFEEISVYWTRDSNFPGQPSDKIDIIAKPEATASTGYRMIGTFDKTIASITQDQVRMFYKATTDLLTFKYRNPLPRGDAAARDLISALFRSTQCKHVRVDFVGGQRCTEKSNIQYLVVIFLSGINLAESEVILAWDCTPLHSTILARRILEQIPKIKKFKVEWQLRGINDSPADAPILDDATLLHVASHTIDCHLVARGTYTVQGIIAAFEVVCNSSNEDKYVQILVEKALIDELFARANRLNEIYERVPLRGVLRMYRDRTRRATLQATCSAIYIQRIPAGVDII